MSRKVASLGVYFHTIEAESGDPATGMTALMLAAHLGDKTMVETLLEVGAQWNAQDDTSKTAGDYARIAGHNEVHIIFPQNISIMSPPYSS